MVVSLFGCAGSSLSHGLLPLVAVSGDCSLVVVHEFLIVEVSLVSEHRF